MDSPRFAQSADTRLLTQRLFDVQVGETITYKQLSAVISRKVTGAFPPLTSARRILKRDYMIVFDAIHGVGLVRLSDKDIVAASAGIAKAVRRASERGVATLACVQDFGSLSRADQMRHTAVSATLAATAHMTNEKALGKISNSVLPTAKQLPIHETLSMFLGKSAESGGRDVPLHEKEAP